MSNLKPDTTLALLRPPEWAHDIENKAIIGARLIGSGKGWDFLTKTKRIV